MPLTDTPVEIKVADRGKCAFCSERTIVPQWRKQIVEHLIVTIDSEGCLHVHGPLTKTAVMETMLEGVRKEMACFSRKNETTMTGDFYEIEGK